MNHKTVRIRFGKYKADVDEKLAPLILNLWKLGFATCNSCEENQPGVAWIEFLFLEDGKKFVQLIAQAAYSAGNIGLYDRIVGEWDVEGMWQHDVHCQDTNVILTYNKQEDAIEVSRSNDERVKIDFTFSVRFPVTDLEAINTIVENEYKKQKDTTIR